ncbi:FixH family protein [Herpetosiphon llansteffanensis]|uniref:FixH family protein n=1 Tax=Herpetosiphon llansteffanensis TaxID=2094568 RepID=UPI0013DF9E71|nr:FixH family protein [Herpetosiphon llansteffanensis]
MLKRLLICLLLLTSLVACGGNDGAQVPAPVEKTVDGVTLKLTAESPLSQNTDQTWVINVSQNGQPVDNADVYLDIDMPSMPMGQNKPLAKGEGNGNYRAQGIYTMGGAWSVSVFAEFAGKEYQATFDVNVPE